MQKRKLGKNSLEVSAHIVSLVGPPGFEPGTNRL